VATLYYPEQGFTFNFDIQGGLQATRISNDRIEICFDEELYVTRALVLTPMPIDEFIRNNHSLLPQFQLSSETVQEILGSLMVWTETGCIEQAL
jgi:hypothetical protein